MAIIVCQKCGAKNRVDDVAAERLQPVCGRCGAKLGEQPASATAGAHPIEVTDDTFLSIVKEAGATPVLLDCWAPWCGPCRMIAPVMEELAAEAQGRFIVGKINTDDNPQISGRFSIDAIPTMLIFKNGNLVDRLVGVLPKQELRGGLRAHLWPGLAAPLAGGFRADRANNAPQGGPLTPFTSPSRFSSQPPQPRPSPASPPAPARAPPAL